MAQPSDEKPAEQPTSVATKNELELPRDLMTKRGSLTSAKSLHEFKRPADDADDALSSQSGTKAKQRISPAAIKNYSEDEITTKRGIRPSKSDTSLTESFVVVDADYGQKKNMNSLRDGELISNEGFNAYLCDV